MSSISSNLSAQLVQSQLSGLKTQSEISTTVAKKAMDTQKDQGQAMVDLLKTATDFAKSSNARGANGRLDVTA